MLWFLEMISMLYFCFVFCDVRVVRMLLVLMFFFVRIGIDMVVR